MGMRQAGFVELAAVDFDPQAIEVFTANFPHVPHVLQKDLRRFKPADLAKLLGTTRVDVIVGGPPCQGFSTIRQRDGSNSGDRLVQDPRRSLYKRFLAFVEFFQPDIFVMENVLGIRSAAKGEYFTRVQLEARKLGYRVHSEVVRAWEFGVPQKRERQLIIGTKPGLPIFAMDGLFKSKATDQVTLWEAIGDLPPLKAGEGEDTGDYDLKRRQQHLARYGDGYLRKTLEIHKTKKLTAHKARPHNERDLRDFARLHQGETSGHAIARGEKMEFPYNRGVFTDRFTRQHMNRLCSTIVAHLSKDGLMFIHPTQTRSLTPREAARVQSFPDWFTLPVSQMHQYRLLGNAVPPLVAKTIGNRISKWFVENKSRVSHPVETEENLLGLIKEAISFTNGELAKVPLTSFKRIWLAVGHYYRHLHPISALENGEEVTTRPPHRIAPLEKISQRLVKPVYKRSGWPKILVPIAEEANRRFKNKKLKADDYYHFRQY